VGTTRLLGVTLLALALLTVAAASIYTTLNPTAYIVESTHAITTKTPNHTATYTASITYQPQQPQRSIPTSVESNFTLQDPAVQELFRYGELFNIREGELGRTLAFLAGEGDLPEDLKTTLGNLEAKRYSGPVLSILDPETGSTVYIEYRLIIGGGHIDADTMITGFDNNEFIASITIETVNVETLDETLQTMIKAATIALILAIPGAILAIREETQKPTTTP